MTVIQVYLIDWSLVHQNIGKISPGGLVTSWLWLPLILFWVWNVMDVRAMVVKKPSRPIFGFLFAAIVLYVIAWNVTDVRLDRLVQRFNDARTVATNLLNPDMITMSIRGNDKICAWNCMSTTSATSWLAARLPAQSGQVTTCSRSSEEQNSFRLPSGRSTWAWRQRAEM